MTRPAFIGLGLTLLAACVEAPVVAPPPPDLPGTVIKYTCEGGSHLTVTYGKGTATLPGNETLLAEEANPDRYSWPSDGTHHVWTLAGAIGTLALHDGTTGTEAAVKSGCKPDGKPG